jgi:hypothetical protein
MNGYRARLVSVAATVSADQPNGMELTMDPILGMAIVESLENSLQSIRECLGRGNMVTADRYATTAQQKLAELEELLALTCDGYVTSRQVAESKLR